MDIRIVREFLSELNDKDLPEQIETLNEIKLAMHEVSPFKNEPVDCVLWVKNETVQANDYNPNSVAPPEMALLAHSIKSDGYTQPIVSWPVEGGSQVIDGFHRNRVGKENKDVRERVHGYLPIVQISEERRGKNDRIASTIRHNRARGKHQVDAMSEIVIELKNRNWRNSRIAKELGMDEEEVLRLCQISGLENLFSDNDFSRAWESSDVASGWDDLTDQIDDDLIASFRTANTGDQARIFHTFEKWECHKAGFYKSNYDGKTSEECKEAYATFLSNDDLFRETLKKIINEWKYSCEHYLTNISMNRIAWLGQAAMCYETGIPSKYCSGFNLLTEEQKEKANLTALEALNEWLLANDRQPIEMEEALSVGRQVEIY